MTQEPRAKEGNESDDLEELRFILITHHETRWPEVKEKKRSARKTCVGVALWNARDYWTMDILLQHLPFTFRPNGDNRRKDDAMEKAIPYAKGKRVPMLQVLKDCLIQID